MDVPPTPTPAPPWPEAHARARRARACLTLLLLLGTVAPLRAGWARILADPASAPRRPQPVAVDLASDPGWRLRLLPGIGHVRAEAILRDRRRSGAPASLEDLARGAGLDGRTLERLRTARTVRVLLAGRPVGCADEPRTASGKRDGSP